MTNCLCVHSRVTLTFINTKITLLRSHKPFVTPPLYNVKSYGDSHCWHPHRWQTLHIPSRKNASIETMTISLTLKKYDSLLVIKKRFDTFHLDWNTILILEIANSFRSDYWCNGSIIGNKMLWLWSHIKYRVTIRIWYLSGVIPMATNNKPEYPHQEMYLLIWYSLVQIRESFWQCYQISWMIWPNGLVYLIDSSLIEKHNWTKVYQISSK